MPVSFEAKPNLVLGCLDKMSDAVYTLMHNVMNGLPRSFRVLDRRILSFPDAVRGETAASIPWMAAFERWMASPNAGCPLFCVPGGSDPQDGGSGSKMAAREDKKPAGYVGQPLGKLEKRRELRMAVRIAKKG